MLRIPCVTTDVALALMKLIAQQAMETLNT